MVDGAGESVEDRPSSDEAPAPSRALGRRRFVQWLVHAVEAIPLPVVSGRGVEEIETPGKPGCSGGRCGLSQRPGMVER